VDEVVDEKVEKPLPGRGPEAYDVETAAEDPGKRTRRRPQRLRGAIAHLVTVRALRRTEREEGGLPIDGFQQAQPGRGVTCRRAGTPITCAFG
jgi:hypothetical protein